MKQKLYFIFLAVAICELNSSYAQLTEVINVTSLPSCSGGTLPQGIRCNAGTHAFKADFSVGQRFVANGITTGGASDASLSNLIMVNQYYVVDIPGIATSSTADRTGYVAAGNTFTNPDCATPYVTIVTGGINIRPSAGDLTNHIYIGGIATNYAQGFIGQRYAVTDSGYDGFGQKWYQIDLPDHMYGGSSPCTPTYYCSAAHGWVNGSAIYVSRSPAVTAIPTVSSLTVSGITSSGATLNWSGQPFPFNSTITIKNHLTGATIATLTNGSCTSTTPTAYALSSLASCTPYTIDVIPSYGSCMVSPATAISFTTTCTCIPPAPPPAPSIISTGCGSVTLSNPGSYYWQGTSCGSSFGYGTGSTFTVTSSGYYYIQAYNPSGGGCWSGCTISPYVTVPSGPTFSATPTNATCCTCANGSMFISASGGTSPYQYSVNGGSWSSSFGSTATASSLLAGTCSVQIKDGSGCLSSTSFVTILAPPAISSISISTGSNFQICTTNPTFSATTTCSGSATWNWTITNQTVSTTPIISSGSSFTAGIVVPGYYRVNLQLTNSAGTTNYVGNFTAAPNPSCTQCLPLNNYVIQQHYPSLFASEPIDVATRSFEYKHTDINMPEIKTSLNFTRYYSSVNDTVVSSLGHGWSHTYDFYIRNFNDSLWTVHFGDGHVTPFIPLIGGSGTSFPLYGGTYETLTKSGGLFTLTFKTGEVYHFDANNKLANIVDLNGNMTVLTYSGLLLTHVSAPGGRYLSINYFGGNIDSVSDGIRTFYYSYTGANLASVKDANSGITSFLYDPHNNITDITNPRGNLLVHNVFDLATDQISSQTDAYSKVTNFVYPSSGNAVITYPDLHSNNVQHDGYFRLMLENEAGHSRSYGYDYNNNLTSFTDENIHTSLFNYDAIGNCLTVTQPGTLPTQFAYSTLNRPTVITDPENHIDSIIYNSSGNITHIHLPNNGNKNYTYYSNGLLLTSKDPNNHTTTYHYNTHGDLTSLVSPAGTKNLAYDSLGRLLFVIDEVNNKIRFSYNNNDKISTIYYPLGVTEVFTHDSDNNLTSFTDKNGNTTYFNYDLKDRLTRIKDAGGGIFSFAYSNMDNMISDSDANGHMHSFGYDVWKRLDSFTNYFGTTSYGYDNAGNKTSQTDFTGLNPTNFGYDALNRRTSSTDYLSNSFTFYYDSLGSITGIKDPLLRNTTYHYNPIRQLDNVNDAAGINTNISYDLNGNRTSIADPNTHNTNVIVDSANRVTSITDAAGHVDSFLLNAIGNIITERKPNGQTITKSYDSLKRVKSVINAGGNNYYYGYYNNGAFRAIKNNSGTDSSYFFYDVTGHLTKNIGVFGDTVRSTYDSVGNRKSIVYPGGHVVTYTYNNENQLLTVTDWLGHITRYNYNAQGRLSDAINPFGDSTHYTYDPAGRLVGQINFLGSALVNSNLFTLDRVGNRTDDSGTGPRPTHLQGATYANSYNPDDGQTSNGYSRYGMDANGNRTSDTLGGLVTSYKFTVDNLLDSIITPTGAVTVFRYDALGNRVQRIDSTGIDKHYVLDLGGSMSQVLQEVVGGGVTANYVYGLGLIARIDGAGNIIYYHFDAQHNVIALSNSSAVVTDTFIYDLRGKMLKHIGNTIQPFAFLGQFGVQQESSSLYYARARYYDASSSNSRFLSKDPYPATLSNPQTINRYVYGINNPIKNIDPLGLWNWETGLEGIVSAASAIIDVTEVVGAIFTAPETGGASLLLLPSRTLALATDFNNTTKDFEASQANSDDANLFSGPIPILDRGLGKTISEVNGISLGLYDVTTDLYETEEQINDAARFGKTYSTKIVNVLYAPIVLNAIKVSLESFQIVLNNGKACGN